MRQVVGFPTRRHNGDADQPDGGRRSRWIDPELREYPVELVLDRTLPDMKPSLTATAEIFVEQHSQVTAVPLAAIYAPAGAARPPWRRRRAR